MQYPKMLYKDGNPESDSVLVQNEAEHKAKGDEGYVRLGEVKPRDPITLLLAGTIPQITDALADLSDEDLAAAEVAEKAKEKPRAGLLAAFDAENEKRKQQK